MGNEMQQLMSDVAKSQEGVLLGLAGIGDTLTKFDERLSKMGEVEERAEELRKEEDLKKAKADFAKEIAITAANIMKEDKEGMDVDGATMRSVSHEDVFNSGGGVGDEQEDDKVTTDIKEVQRPLQLMMKELRKEMRKEMASIKKHMLKEHAHMYEDEDGDGEPDIMEDVMTEDAEEDMDMGMDMDMDSAGDMEDDEDSEWGVEESADYPMDMDEEEEDEDDFDKMYKSISKNPAAFKKFLKVQKANINKQAKKQAEAILKQQGFVQDKGIMPKRSNARKSMGLDDSVLGSQVNKGGNGKANKNTATNGKNPMIDIVKSNSDRSWESLAKDYVDFYDTKVPSGIITDEIRELYG